MKSIKFNDSEVEFLINHYELELLDAENYIADLKNILKKLGSKEKYAIEPTPISSDKKEKKAKPGRPRKNKPVSRETPVKKEKGKRGRPKKIAVEVPAPLSETKTVAPVKEIKAKKTRAKKTVRKTAPKKTIHKTPVKPAPVETTVPVNESIKPE